MNVADSSGLLEYFAERPHLFSGATVRIHADGMTRMREAIAAIEAVVALPAYRERALAWAPAIARHEPPNKGVFFGYDFHLSTTGPKLIEINTNAGGGLLAASQLGEEGRGKVEEAFVAMFRTECPTGLGTIAIVDEAPEAQYLYPEFLLFRDLFECHGIHAVICDPRDLMVRDRGLWHGGTRIDLVYNRLTDFALVAPASATLRQAYVEGMAVVSPNPRGHALYADKRNLSLLSDDAFLAEWGVDEATRRVLAAVVPRTEIVSSERAEEFWRRRRDLFFKPAGGYGSKAAYRGDKMTKRVFEEVLEGGYVAQALVPPSTVAVAVGGEMSELKVDIRCYAYHQQVQLVAARLWQGQTTNFRTPGGGFARVMIE